jgi:hypothetical protein
MKKKPHKKPLAPQQPKGDRKPGTPPLADPPTESPPVDETDVLTSAVEAMRIDES